MIKWLYIVIFFLISLTATSQKRDIVLPQYEDSINNCFNKIIAATNDSVKFLYNEYIKHHFRQVLHYKASFQYPFDSLKNMGIITAPDKQFRLYNWNLQLANGEFEYFGFLQVVDKKEKSQQIFSLSDHSDEIKMPEHETTTHENWFGALYYQIILVKERRNNYYTLIGWDGHNDFSNRKIIDVLYFTKSGNPKFGKKIFKMGDEKKKRIIFEYSYLASMALKYNDKLSMIVYDHLAPSSPKFEGQYQYYGPDFSYDGLYFKNGKWIQERNIDVRNPKTRNIRKKNISYTF